MQFSIYRHPGNDAYPFLLDVQSDLIQQLNTRLAIPLLPHASATTLLPDRLCPTLVVEGSHFYVMTHEMASIRASMIGDYVCSAEGSRTIIKNAIDFLIDGF